MTNGRSAGPWNSSGHSIAGLDSPFLTISLQDELSLPDSHRISPSSSISSLLKMSWCLPPPRFLISTLLDNNMNSAIIFKNNNFIRSIRMSKLDKSYLSLGTIGVPLKDQTASAVWSCNSTSRTTLSLSIASVSFNFLLKRFESVRQKTILGKLKNPKLMLNYMTASNNSYFRNVEFSIQRCRVKPR